MKLKNVTPLNDYANLRVPVMHLLTDGNARELNLNAAGQVKVSDVHADLEHACELLDAAPSEVRYGYVTPGPKIERGVSSWWW